MSRETILFKSEEKKSRAEAAAVLHQIADKVSEGAITLRHGEVQVELQIPERVELEIKAEEEIGKRQTTKRSLEIEIEWIEGDQAAGSLSIE